MNAMTLRAILTRIVTTLITLFGVAVIVFVVDPPRARRSDRHDAAARRLAGRHRPPARALRPRQIDPRAVLHLARPASCTAISARRSRCAQNVLEGRSRPPAGDARALPPRAPHRRSLGGTLAFVATRWRETPAETGVDIVNGIALVGARFPLGPGAHPRLRRRLSGLRDFGPRLADARSSLRHAVLSDRKHRCGCASTSPPISSTTC